MVRSNEEYLIEENIKNLVTDNNFPPCRYNRTELIVPMIQIMCLLINMKISL